MASKKKKNSGYIPFIIVTALIIIAAIAGSVISKLSNKVPKNLPQIKRRLEYTA